MKFLDKIHDIFYCGIIEIRNLLLLLVGYYYYFTKKYGEKVCNVYDPIYKNTPKLNRVNWGQYRNLKRFNKNVKFESISYLISIIIIILISIRFPLNLYKLITFLK